MNEPVMIDMCTGFVRLVQTQKVNGSKLYLGGFAIHCDRSGNELRRTENQWNVVLECHTEKEAKRLADTRLSGQTSAGESR